MTALNALVEPRQAVNQRIMCGNLWVQQVFDICTSISATLYKFKGGLKMSLLEINRAAAVCND